MGNETAMLREEIGKLREQFVSLANALEAASLQLKAQGLPPKDSLDTQLGNARMAMSSLGARLLAQLPPSASGVPHCVDSLEALERTLDEHEERKGRELTNTAGQVLDTLLGLRHRNGRLESEIRSVLDAARTTAKRLRELESEKAKSLADEIVSRVHPLSALLALIRESSEVDEDVESPLVDRVIAAFGTPMMLAAIRGQLECGDDAAMPMAESQPDEHIPIGRNPNLEDATNCDPDDQEPDSREGDTLPNVGLEESVVANESSPITASTTTCVEFAQVANRSEGVATAPTVGNSPLEGIAVVSGQLVRPPAAPSETTPLPQTPDGVDKSATPRRFETLPEELRSFEEFCANHYLTAL